MPPEPCVISCDTAMEDGNPAVSWGEKLKRVGVCVCMCVCAEEARFHEVTISLSVERATGVGRGRVLGVIPTTSLVEDAFGPRHSCQTTSVIPTQLDSPAANFRKRRIPWRHCIPPHRHCDRLGTSRDHRRSPKSSVASCSTWHVAVDESINLKLS